MSCTHVRTRMPARRSRPFSRPCRYPQAGGNSRFGRGQRRAFTLVELPVVSPFDMLRPGKRKSLAFTLVELLVVVAIIALLISILLPSLTRAKGIARMVKCSTNQHAIVRGAHMYASDYNDHFHRDSWWGWNTPDKGQYLFASRISPYVGGPDIPLQYEYNGPHLYDIFREMPVYMCPSFQDLEYALTYLSNGWDFVDNSHQSSPPYPLSKMKMPPAEVGYIVELNPGALSATSRVGGIVFGGYDVLGFAHSGHLINYDLTFNDDGTPNTSGRMILFNDQRHFGRTTVGFFDGHCENRSLTKDDLPARLFFPDY